MVEVPAVWQVLGPCDPAHRELLLWGWRQATCWRVLSTHNLGFRDTDLLWDGPGDVLACTGNL